MDFLLTYVSWPVLVVLGYIFLMSVITFLTFVTDKSYAVAGAHRTKEKTLLVLSLLGGTLGAMVAMTQFRHKTKKVSFLSKFIAIVVLQIVVVAALWFLYARISMSAVMT